MFLQSALFKSWVTVQSEQSWKKTLKYKRVLVCFTFWSLHYCYISICVISYFWFLEHMKHFLIIRNMSKVVTSVHTTQTHPCKPFKQHKQRTLHHTYTYIKRELMHVYCTSYTYMCWQRARHALCSHRQQEEEAGVWGGGIMTNISFISLKNNCWVLKGQL